jgi:hypothetical protein
LGFSFPGSLLAKTLSVFSSTLLLCSKDILCSLLRSVIGTIVLESNMLAVLLSDQVGSDLAVKSLLLFLLLLATLLSVCFTPSYLWCVGGCRTSAVRVLVVQTTGCDLGSAVRTGRAASGATCGVYRRRRVAWTVVNDGPPST